MSKSRPRIRPLNAEKCSYRCPYYMDGPVLSLCKIDGERLVYNGSVPPQRTELCKQEGQQDAIN